MRKLLILLIVMISISSRAQSSNYKKIMADRYEISQDVFFTQLQEYQKENAQYANVYYQMGKVELSTFASLDPIVERIASRQYINNAKTNFGLAKNFVDEKDLLKNPGWYDAPDIKDKDSVRSLALKSINENYESTIDYTEHYEKLLIHYDKAVFHYLEAQQNFISINTSADNLRQLFLGADDSLKVAVKQVGVSFDSSMHHLNIYRDTYQLLPHFDKREVNVTLHHIDHFRMNGITPTNFLADNIDVWNYNEWSERFLNQIVEEVDGLQEEIKTAYNFFISTNNRMMEGDECLQANIDDLKFQRIINLVTKYDNESLLIDIFQYLISKLAYGNQLVYEKNCNVFDSAPTEDFLSRKGRIYKNLFEAFLITDSLAENIISTDHGQATFQWFFDEMMDGENGGAAFASDQRKENSDAFKGELKKLIDYRNIQSFNVDSIDIRFGIDGNKLVQESDSINFLDSLWVVKKLELGDSLHLLMSKNIDSYFIIGGIQEEDNYHRLWQVETVNKTPIDYFKMVGDSSFIIGGYDKVAWIKNVRMNGAEGKEIKLKSADTIVNVTFNDLQGEFTVLQKGANSNYTLSTVNYNGNITSNTSLDLQGQFISMTRQEQEIWFFSQAIKDGVSVINATIINGATKEIANQLSYTFSGQMENSFIVKNDNKSLTLVGYSALANDELIYALLDYEANIQDEQIF